MVRCLANFLQSKGEEVVVISPRLIGEEGSVLTPIFKSRYRRSLAFILFAARKAKHFNPDVVLFISSVSSLLGMKTSILRNSVQKPLFLYLTGLRRAIMGYRISLNTDKVVVGSDYLKGFFPEADTVPPFIDTSAFNKRISKKNCSFIQYNSFSWGL